VQPVKTLVKTVHRYGAKVLVDDAQYIATGRHDVRDSGADMTVFSGHKLGGPTGVGVVYVKKALLRQFLPYCVGGGTVQYVRLDGGGRLQVKYLPAPAGFEAGVQHYAGIIGLGEAVSFMRKVGSDRIWRHTRDMTQYLYAGLSGFEQVKVFGRYPQAPQGALLAFSFRQKRISLYDFNMFLNERVKGFRILVRTGHHCAQPAHQSMNTKISMRLSFFIYNTRQEIDVFLDALEEYLRYFR